MSLDEGKRENEDKLALKRFQEEKTKQKTRQKVSLEVDLSSDSKCGT